MSTNSLYDGQVGSSGNDGNSFMLVLGGAEKVDGIWVRVVLLSFIISVIGRIKNVD